MAAKNNSKNVNPPTAKNPGVKEVDDLATVPTNTGLSPGAAPAWLTQKMTGQKVRGLENMEREDRIYPRLVLCQGQTPFVQNGKAAIGDIVDNLTGEVLAHAGERLEFVPVVMSKSRMFLKDMDEGGGILCRADNAQEARLGGCGKDQGGEPTRACADCVLKEWDDSSEDGKPKCTMFYNVVGFLPKHGDRLFVWSTKSTGVKVVKRFLSICAATGADFFAHRFDLFSVEAQSGNFKFRQWDFEGRGFVDEAEYALGERVYKSLAEKAWSVSVDDIEKPVDEKPAAEEAYEENLDTAATPAPVKAAQATVAATPAAKPAPAKAQVKPGEEIPF